MQRLLFIFFIVFNLNISIADEEYNWDAVTGDIAFNTPRAVLDYMRNTSSEMGDEYRIYSNINPFFQRLDINGDGKMEYAVLVQRIQDNKVGILFCFDKNKGTMLFGGHAVKSTRTGKVYDDLKSSLTVSMWYVSKVKKLEHMPEAPPPYGKPYGESLVIGSIEAWQSHIYWDGKKFMMY